MKGWKTSWISLAPTYQPDAEILCITHGGLLYAAIPGIVNNIPYAFVREHLLDNTECIVIDWDGTKLEMLPVGGD